MGIAWLMSGLMVWVVAQGRDVVSKCLTISSDLELTRPQPDLAWRSLGLCATSQATSLELVNLS